MKSTFAQFEQAAEPASSTRLLIKGLHQNNDGSFTLEDCTVSELKNIEVVHDMLVDNGMDSADAVYLMGQFTAKVFQFRLSRLLAARTTIDGE